MAATGTVLAGRAASAGAEPASGRPNILLIMTDDQPAWTLRWQPKLRDLMIDQGTTFDGSCVADPLCGPNRTSVLLGRYSHNHGIKDNTSATEKFRAAGYEGEHYGLRLGAAGYRTGYFGKWLNIHPGRLVPAGWDHDYYLVGNQANPNEFYINDSGKLKTISHSVWDDTDLLAEKAAAFVGANVSSPMDVFPEPLGAALSVRRAAHTQTPPP